MAANMSSDRVDHLDPVLNIVILEQVNCWHVSVVRLRAIIIQICDVETGCDRRAICSRDNMRQVRDTMLIALTCRNHTLTFRVDILVGIVANKDRGYTEHLMKFDHARLLAIAGIPRVRAL